MSLGSRFVNMVESGDENRHKTAQPVPYRRMRSSRLRVRATPSVQSALRWRFREQLATLHDLGFDDRENVALGALVRCDGEVGSAASMLLHRTCLSDLSSVGTCSPSTSQWSASTASSPMSASSVSTCVSTPRALRSTREAISSPGVDFSLTNHLLGCLDNTPTHARYNRKPMTPQSNSRVVPFHDRTNTPQRIRKNSLFGTPKQQQGTTRNTPKESHLGTSKLRQSTTRNTPKESHLGTSKLRQSTTRKFSLPPVDSSANSGTTSLTESACGVQWWGLWAYPGVELLRRHAQVRRKASGGAPTRGAVQVRKCFRV